MGIGGIRAMRKRRVSPTDAIAEAFHRERYERALAFFLFQPDVSEIELERTYRRWRVWLEDHAYLSMSAFYTEVLEDAYSWILITKGWPLIGTPGKAHLESDLG
jgi:hypothetical protein